MDAVNLKSNLGYVVAERHGSVIELEKKQEEVQLKSSQLQAFIKLGYYNWSKLELADEYYTDLYDQFSKLYQIVKFKLKGK